MKTKIILPIFFLMALSLSMFASALDNCSDSDDGTNYFTKGLVIPRAGDEQVWDSCKNSKVLYEGTCDEQGGKVYEYECPGTCEDGACVCSDSDDGKDYFTKGLIISRAGDEQVWDSCKTDYILYEGTCDEQGGAVYEYQCPNGCLEGVCKQEEPNTCSDSDDGKDYSTKGYTEGVHAGNEFVWKDECDSSNLDKIIERFCDDENRPHDQYYTCPRGCLDGACLSTCSDSDDGKDYFSKGIVVTSDETFTDTCDGKILTEGTCDEQGGKVYEYECPGTCEDGACVCSDSDDGKDYFTKGLVIPRAGDEQVWDSCKTDYILLEGTCDEQGGAVYEHECLNGCSEGACQKFEPSGETGPVDLPKNISEEEIVMLCNGCGLDGKCYPFNYRKDKNYCSIDKEFIPQLKSESSCENNFECGSNICIDDICVKEGLFKRFLNWFRRLFG